MKNYFWNLLLILILVVAVYFRVTGFNWDGGFHLHPDERFLTMVLLDLDFPKNFYDYLNPVNSPLSPYNRGHEFYVYGTLPLNFVFYLSHLLKMIDYSNIHFVGRGLVLILDLGVVFLLYLISQKIFNKRTAVLTSFFYAICVFPIQISHFYTVDSFLNFFLVLSFYLMTCFKKDGFYLRNILLSIGFALALSCKVTAIYFLPIILLFFYFFSNKNIKKTFFNVLNFGLVSILFFRLLQPHVFASVSWFNWSLNQKFLTALSSLGQYNKSLYYPPGIQWLSKIPLLFPLQNILFWGLGLFFGLFFLFSLFFNIKFCWKNRKNKKTIWLVLIVSWIFFLFLIQGSRKVTTMRYFLPIYPFICLSVAWLFDTFFFKQKSIVQILLIGGLSIYPLAFLSIYKTPHTRIQATDWINNSVERDKILSYEYWDDPVPLDNFGMNYETKALAMADPDSREKWIKISRDLQMIDYQVLSSNRLWASILAVPGLYPQSSNYYKKIFKNELGFSKIKEFNSYPGFKLQNLKSCYYFGFTNMPNDNSFFKVENNCQYPGIYLRDDLAEEAFSVYDHPKVLIFKKSSY